MSQNNLIENIIGIEDYTYVIKIFYMCVMSYYIIQKITNQSIKKRNILIALCMFIIAIIDVYIKKITDNLTEIMALIFMLSMLIAYIDKANIGYTIVITIMTMSINYIILVISISIVFIPNIFLKINNNLVNMILIISIYITIIYKILSINKIKYGISFLKPENQDSYLDLIILNISVIILFFIIIILNANVIVSRKFYICLICSSIIMFITIQKSLQLYYKQKMLIKDLTETKEELENKKKEIEELEAENIRISKKNHTIVHKQKSIEHKLEEMLIKSEISIEEAGEVKERLEKLHTQIYSEKENTELDKTGISDIDDMLNYMQSECTKNKIEFTLVIKGNIHYMVNNLISKEDLETLIADHIKDAIIAINHTDNINRSILVKLGNIDGIYSLYIYDSGVEFKKEVLENLGIKPFTTYENEGGTGMGFMNTFDTLRKCKASLIIEEFNEPKPDNYTKLIAIKFDNNNKFEIKSYRKIEIKKKI